MKSDITIGNYKVVKPAAVKIHKSVKDLVETCEITLPLTPYLREDNTDGTIVQERDILLKAGDKVTVALGYDDDVTERFTGFVARINKSVPMTVYCEGYSYQLRNRVLNKSYNPTTLKQILADTVAGTDITISSRTADVAIPSVFFQNVPALKVLERVQKELLCSVYFDGKELYAGATPYAMEKPTEVLRLGWNTAKDSDLQQVEAPDLVQITLVEKSKAGETKKTKNADKKYSANKEVKIRAGMPEAFKREVAAYLQDAANYAGYEGKITTLLVPFIDKGYTVEIEDRRYPERAGRYFAEAVDTTYGSGGGRQDITLKHYGKQL